MNTVVSKRASATPLNQPPPDTPQRMNVLGPGGKIWATAESCFNDLVELFEAQCRRPNGLVHDSPVIGIVPNPHLGRSSLALFSYHVDLEGTTERMIGLSLGPFQVHRRVEGVLAGVVPLHAVVLE